jgi:pyruvate dehydrogenase E1 component alpha subunit
MAERFKRGEIKAPLHLSGGNEDQLIEIFQDIRPEDWVFTSWRSHYHCLLKGVPPLILRDAILKGRSINLCFPKYRILSSAIVGGVCPIAVGVGWAIKRNRGKERVYVFSGDMTAMTGIFYESRKYAYGHNLPVTFIVEDNGKSVCTDTREVWGWPFIEATYKYDMTRPHVGVGTWVAL